MNKALKIKSLGLGLALAVLLSPSFARAQDYVPSDECLANREAFQAERFGVFIHWGIYSMLASGEWVQNSRNINYQEYAKLAHGFYPANFNAAEWVATFKAAGAKYITITSRHHDGFSMFGTKYSPYNIVDATPFGRDVLKELAEECEKQGLALHFYYSLIDWGREDAPRGGSGLKTGRPTETVDEDSYFEFMKNQLTELLTNYGSVVRAIWFDGHWDQKKNPDFNWRYDELYGLIHELRPDVLVGNNHHLEPFPGEDFQLFEKDLPGENTTGFAETAAEISPLPLETCETMNGSWGYHITDTNYKDVPTLIRYLVRTAGRDANLLLNVGPRPDGTLPNVAVEELKAMGEWLNEYGHTIYGTRGGEMPAHDWGVMTRRDNVRYVHILSWKDDSIYVPFTAGNVASAVCLNTGDRVRFFQDDDGVVLKLGGAPTEVDHIIELTLKDHSAGETSAQKTYFANYTKYAKANAELPAPTDGKPRVVFLGNSITDGWAKSHEDFFTSNGYIGRGISGQTSYQFLLRFREDVINLSPSLVVINAGSNDIAENTDPYCEDYTFDNIVSMVELADANNIKVILTSVLPASSYWWNKEITDAPQKIKSLNKRIEDYAQAHGIPFVNYFYEMLAYDGVSLHPKYSNDGVHPTSEGYDVMERLIKPVIDKTL